MNRPVRVELVPLGRTIEVQRGTPLQDVLFAQGVEFPCGGRGRCKGCRVKVLQGQLPAGPDDVRLLTPSELAEGWRLACRAHATEDLKIELAQWEAAILADNTPFSFTPRSGLGVAVDLGTTTVVAQLLDLATGHVLGVQMGLNVQAQHGADIMSRIDFGMTYDGQATLTRLIRSQIGGMISRLMENLAPSAECDRPRSQQGSECGSPLSRSDPHCVTDTAATGDDRTPAQGASLRDIVIVGNTVMHHLFCGVSVTPLSHHPFEPEHDGLHTCPAEVLGWSWPGQPIVRFLPCLGGFVGSDILAGILATRQHENEGLQVLLDLGTNGEIVVGNRHRMLCASTAAGPAFEGARISMGMRAATGAISEVHLQDGRLKCHVLGHLQPRGLCGSGLVDAIACGLDLGWIQPSGRTEQGRSMELAAPVTLTQADVRELQLAKGAIAAGVRLLLQQWGAKPDKVERVYLAGAFGNYISKRSAARIGLLSFSPEQVQSAGNTALLGAKLALFNLHQSDGYPPQIRQRVTHVPLSDDPQFQEIFAEEMGFPPQ